MLRQPDICEQKKTRPLFFSPKKGGRVFKDRQQAR